jgi:acyl carrier protein
MLDASLARTAMPPTVLGPILDDSVQSIVVGFWRELLERDDFEDDADFFDLGGHSLLAMQLLARIHEHFGIELSLVDLFDHGRLRQQVNLIERELVTTLRQGR